MRNKDGKQRWTFRNTKSAAVQRVNELGQFTVRQIQYCHNVLPMIMSNCDT